MNFKCILCGTEVNPIETGFRPRDRQELSIVDCPKCGHRQLFPLMSEAELEVEYDTDRAARATSGVVISAGSDFETMRKKFVEWTKIHADMYWDKLQECKKVLNLGSGYGFLEEELNRRNGKKFEIVGNEIGKFRTDNYVGGVLCTVDFAKEGVPLEMQGQFDLVMAVHLLEHINDPISYLKNIRSLLNENGRILVEVPNLNCYLCEISEDYEKFFYFCQHVSYFTEKTLPLVLEKAGYKNITTYTKELYSLENHMNWVKTGKPFIQYNQMYMSEPRLEFINEIYKEKLGNMHKGFALVCEATV